MLLHYGSLSLNFKAHMAVHPFCYPTPPHYLTHTSLFRAWTNPPRLPVSSATAPTAAGTAPRAGLRGSWSVLVQNYPPSPGAVGCLCPGGVWWGQSRERLRGCPGRNPAAAPAQPKAPPSRIPHSYRWHAPLPPQGWNLAGITIPAWADTGISGCSFTHELRWRKTDTKLNKK